MRTQLCVCLDYRESNLLVLTSLDTIFFGVEKKNARKVKISLERVERVLQAEPFSHLKELFFLRKKNLFFFSILWNHLPFFNEIIPKVDREHKIAHILTLFLEFRASFPGIVCQLL